MKIKIPQNNVLFKLMFYLKMEGAVLGRVLNINREKGRATVIELPTLGDLFHVENRTREFYISNVTKIILVFS